MKYFVKALDKDGHCFQYIFKSFPSPIRRFMGDQKF